MQQSKISKLAFSLQKAAETAFQELEHLIW